MNRTIISIEVQDHGGKEAKIIVRGERNNQILFEEQFDYKDEEKYSLRLHLLSERFHRKFPQLGDSLGILCLRKLFNDITIRSKMKANPDYREKEHTQFSFDDYKAFCHKYFPAQNDDVIENNWKSIQSLPKGTIIRLPDMGECLIGSFEVCAT
jgi:hypothetical protein